MPEKRAEVSLSR